MLRRPLRDANEFLRCRNSRGRRRRPLRDANEFLRCRNSRVRRRRPLRDANEFLRCRNSRVRRLLPAMHFRQQSGGTPHACGGTPLHGARYDKMPSRHAHSCMGSPELRSNSAWARIRRPAGRDLPERRRNCAAILPGQEYVDLAGRGLPERRRNCAAIPAGQGAGNTSPLPASHSPRFGAILDALVCP